jgi:hypothetical protein
VTGSDGATSGTAGTGSVEVGGCGSLVFSETDSVVFDAFGSLVIDHSTFTVEAWVTLSGPGARGNYHSLVSQIAEGDLTNSSFSASIVSRSNGSACATTPGMLRVFNDGSTSPYCVSSSGAMSGSTAWHHVAYVYNGTDISFYVDGVAFGSGSIRFTAAAEADVLYVGAAGSTDAWNGAISTLRISSGALYTSGFTPGVLDVEADSLALFEFFEGTGTETIDAVSGRAAVINGAAWSADCPDEYAAP